MTAIQEKMQALISKEELERAFDARFPREMKEKFSNARLGDTNDIQTRKMMRRLYVCGDQKTDVGNGIGLIAPRVAACAAHQANKVLQLILQS